MLLARTILPALAAAAVLAPGAAEAKTFCATHDVVPCPAGAVNTGVDIQAALDAAAASSGADVVRITGGNYTTDADGFDVPVGDPLTIDGTGATIQADGLKAGEAALDAQAATVHGLRFQLVDGAFRTAIRSTGGLLVDVTAAGTGPDQRGAQLGSAKAVRLGVDLDGTSAVGVSDNGGVVVVEDSVLDATTAVFASQQQTTVRRSTLKGSATTTGRLTVEDTIAHPRNGGLGLAAMCSPTGTSLVATHVTVVGGTAGTAGAGVACNGAGTATVELRASILATPKSLRVSEYAGTTSLVASRSALDPGAVDVKAGQADLALAGTLPVPPFAAPANPELPDGSPLIDAADPATATAADRFYRERPRDGDGDGVAGPDVGALEHAAVPPKAQPAGPSSGGAGDAAPVTKPAAAPTVPAQPSGPTTARPRIAPVPPVAAQPDLARALRSILAARRAGRAGARYANLAGAKLTITWKVGGRVVARRTAKHGRALRLKPTARLRRGAKVTVTGTLVRDGRTVTAKVTQRAR